MDAWDGWSMAFVASRRLFIFAKRWETNVSSKRRNEHKQKPDDNCDQDLYLGLNSNNDRNKEGALPCLFDSILCSCV